MFKIHNKKNANYAIHYKMLWLLCAIFFLTSCSSFHKKDGPPSFYVDASRIHDAVPKKEPLSKYGNMSSYHVFGKRYYTLKNSIHYNQVGIASWYGMQFHNHSTSSGEPYNVLAMTAAHKTLPLPTYVAVTNLVNHRQIIVKVNDRGPFESNRLIDLSYVAAKKLGMLGHGTALVRVKAINLEANQESRYLASSHRYTHQRFKASHRNIYLNVGTFTDKSYAMRLKKRLTPILHAPLIMTTQNNPTKSHHAHHLKNNHLAKLTRYRIIIGPIQNITLANQIQTKLKHLGL